MSWLRADADDPARGRASPCRWRTRDHREGHNPIEWERTQVHRTGRPLFVGSRRWRHARGHGARSPARVVGPPGGRLARPPGCRPAPGGCAQPAPYLEPGRDCAPRKLHVAARLRRARTAEEVIASPPAPGASGCRVSARSTRSPTGHFPRAPEPVVENLGELETLVRESEADVGFAVDPDGDRLALVDATGRAFGEVYTLALATALILSRDAGSTGPVVTNLSTSRLIEDVAAERGVAVIRTPVGKSTCSSCACGSSTRPAVGRGMAA